MSLLRASAYGADFARVVFRLCTKKRPIQIGRDDVQSNPRGTSSGSMPLAACRPSSRRTDGLCLVGREPPLGEQAGQPPAQESVRQSERSQVQPRERQREWKIQDSCLDGLARKRARHLVCMGHARPACGSLTFRKRGASVPQLQPRGRRPRSQKLSVAQKLHVAASIRATTAKHSAHMRADSTVSAPPLDSLAPAATL